MTDKATLAAVRFGYGPPLSGAGADPAAMIAALAGPDLAAKAWPAVSLLQALPAYRVSAAARVLARNGDAERKAYRDAVRVVRRQAVDATQATFARAVSSDDGFRERLVRFWADHFTTVGRFQQDVTLPLALIEDAIRPHVAGRFGDMLREVTLQPAMLMYLDQVQSIGPGSPVGLKRARGLNENLARELIELHTLGVGAGYSQADVTQMAELLTGLRFDPEAGLDFDEKWAEPGPETVLGKTYDGEGLAPIKAALEDLAKRPETAAHIARKLVVHFVADVPDAALVARLTQVFLATGGDLLAVYTALLNDPAAWETQMGKARQPFDFIVASLRALGLGGKDMLGYGDGKFRRMILLPMQAMGQPWGTPGGPDGWPEPAQDWITPQGLASRISWAMEMPARLVPVLPEPVAFAKTALGGLASERLLWAVERAETVREGVGLVLASAEFNRR
ncbi:MAG: DUF1800 domain-containing protein [Paracoccaceae bacterium]